MKNKVLATLLAVCLFAGLAVPAFADYYSSVEGDPTKATMIDFYDDGKVITELTIKNGSDKDISKLVRIFEDKDTLVLDKSYLTYSLEGDSLAFGINESTVTAIDDKGSINVIVSSTLDNKVVGKLKIKAAPAAAEKYATGFRFKDTINTVTVGTDSEASTIKVSPVPAGSKFIDAQLPTLKSDIAAALGDVLASQTLTATPTTIGDSNDVITFSGLRQDETVKKITVTKGTVAGATTMPTVVAKFATDTKDIEISITTTSDYDASTKLSISSLQAAIRKISPAATVTAVTSANAALTVLTCIAAPASATSENVTAATPVVVTPSAAPNDDGDMEFTVAANNAIVPSAKKNVKVVIPVLDGNNQTTTRSITSTTTVQAVKAKPATAIGGPGQITIEVGEVYDTDGKMAYGPSAANVDKAYTLVNDYYNVDSNANDYASVDGKKILGVKTGKSKIVASLESDSTKTATIIVNVVAKGTKPAAGGNTTVLSAWAPKLGVGETANIVVKADGDVTYKSLNEAVATVDAAGKITAVKEGVAKISVQEEGKDIVYLTVTVGATTTKPEDKPTDVPQTAVAALVALF